MSDLTVFAFDTQAVRVVMVGGEPWFVALDVCTALNLQWKGSGSTGSLAALDADEKGVSSIDTPGGTQEVAIISESGLYTLILRCRDAISPGSAPHRFRRWVTHEVLPSIRKTGRYELPPPDLASTPRLPQPADRIAAASRIFNQLVRSGNVARVALPAAIRRAAAVALRETGVDMVAELGIAAHVEAMEALALSGRGWNGDEPASPGYASVVRFWEGWADGSLGLPFQSCTTAQAYAAYAAWCGNAGVSHTLRRERFTVAVQQCSCRRGRTATVKVMRQGAGPDAPAVRMLLVSEPPAEAQGAWAGEVVKAFAEQLDGFLIAIA